VLSAFAQPLIRFVAGPAFAPGAVYVPWLVLAYLARTVAGQFRTAFLLEKRTGEDAVVTWSGGLACMAGYALLIPTWKVWGAVIATCIGFGVMFVVGLIRAQSVRYFPYDFRRLAGIGLVSLAAVSIATFSRPAELNMQLIQGTAVVIGSLAFLMIPGAVQAQEKHFVGGLIREIRRRWPLAA
jgi:O-antigen/teichoic acid export membrane protein